MKTFPRITQGPVAIAYLSTNQPWTDLYRISLAILIWLCAASFALGQTPTTSITFPRFNSSFIAGANIEIRATAATSSTATTVSKVEFFVQEAFSGSYNSIGVDDTAPYSINWTVPTPSQPSRSYQIRAVVTASNSLTALANPNVGYYSINVYRSDYVSNRNWYVNAAAPSANTAGTEAAPVNTLQKAFDRVAPGDTVFVMGGTPLGGSASMQRTGLPDKWIVIKPYKNDKPAIKMNDNDWNGLLVLPAAAYIRIEGLEVIGNSVNQPLESTLPQALNQPGSCANPAGAPLAKYNGNGISVDGRNGRNVQPHHIAIANNVVHDCGGGGIATLEADYITIEDNTIYNTSWYTIYATSGISLFHPWNFDNNTTGYRNIVRNNKSYSNRLYVPWVNGCRLSDGNGIIIDDFENSQSSSTIQGQLYTGRTLVANNVLFNNGGSGVILYKGINVDVINNTSYQNSQSDPTGELYSNASRNINIINNIIQPIKGERTSVVTSNTAVTYSNNLYIVDDPTSQVPTQTPSITVVNNSIIAPSSETAVFANPGINGATADFRLIQGSPAINAGSSAYLSIVPVDFLDVSRPQGSGVDIGAYEFKGQPIAITQQPASGSTVCVGTNVTASVNVDGTVRSYQWYKDGVALTGVTSATTATLSLSNVATEQQGSYAVVITGFNSLTSNAFSLTVNSPPAAPNASSLTVTQGTPNVTLSVSNCAGVVNWNSSDGEASLPVSTSAVGEFVYSVTCKIGACISPITSVTVSVKAPLATLSVYHRDADNNQLTNNTIRPYLKLYNEGTTAVPYSELTVRYWLTVENFASLTNLSVYWAELGASKVKLKYVALPQPRQGAFGYIEYSFDASAGNLAGGNNSGEIQTGLGKQNWTAFNEADDYSFAPNTSYTKNDRITVYRNGSLVGGVEPVAVTPVTTLKVYSENKNTNPATNQISTHLKLANEGNLPVDYSQLTVRYWLSSEGDKPLVYTVDYADLGGSNVRSKFVKENRAGTDTYLELSFTPTIGSLNPLSSTGIIQQRINKNDWSTFNEANDYSYRQAGALAENAKITAYLNGTLIYGQEPGLSGARVSAELSGLQVVVLGNPIREGSEVVDVEVKGVEGQPLWVSITDVQGRLVSHHKVEKASSVERCRLSITQQQTGIFLMQVRTDREKQTVKLIK